MAKNKVKETPLMQQHASIKQKYPDAILLFRVGDFYETFGQDAVITAQVLGITLTKRNNGGSDLELAGFPYHSLDTYLHKLVKAGYRVAVCDQLEDPKQVKGIVKRGVTELVTPGVATNDKLLEHNTNNFLAAIQYAKEVIGVAFLDITTGEFFIAEGNMEYAEKLLQTFRPAEVIYQRSFQKQFKEKFGTDFYTYTLESWIFDKSFATESLLNHFQVHSLKGYGIENMQEGIIAAGAILHYLKETEHPNLQHITNIQRIEQDDYLWMDRFTIRNLELLNSPAGIVTLLDVLDNTATSMGARLLKRWIALPLKDVYKINERLDAVEFFILEPDIQQAVMQQLKQVGDIERLVSKIPLKKISPRELLQLAKSIQSCVIIKDTCQSVSNPYLSRLSDAINPCTYIVDKIIKEIDSNPPSVAAKGNIIQAGIHQELDALRSIATGGKDYLVDIQQREIKQTGISSLKIGFNNVFGYYLEVTNAHKDKVPEAWIRKQTLTNAERYITPELKEYEEKIIGAEEKILKIELELYENLLNELQDYLALMQVNGNALAIIDCLVCFALNAKKYQYTKPLVNEGKEMQVTECRHPVIERHLPAGESYIPNDISLNPDDEQIIILTGPNMSGKSALLRQVALVTLMSHIGSFVAAKKAIIPLTDKIFTRVGASDNLSGGESTFMVEMNETASIINNLSARSLVLLDEIGRGTSTYDGISIAWSIVEYLHNTVAKPKTLFATHYHELNELEDRLSGVKNYHVTNREVNGKIIFLRKLARGGSTHSFGIHVAKMAGMPATLIQRANEILQQLEDIRSNAQDATNQDALPKVSTVPQGKIKEAAPQIQLSIFDAQTEVFECIRKQLHDIDINRLTPVEALMKLNEIKGLLK